MEKCNLDIVIFSIILDGMCGAGKFNTAWEIFSCLPAKGLQINVYAYTIMVNGFAKQGLLDKIEDLLRNLEENRCIPDSCTYNIFVQGLVAKREIARSIKYLTMTRDKCFSVYATTIEMIINYLSTNQGDNELREFLFPK